METRKRGYRVMEHDCSRNASVNLLAVDNELRAGSPFTRHFHVVADLRMTSKKRREADEMEQKYDEEQEKIDTMLFADTDSDCDTEMKPEKDSEPKQVMN